MTAAAGPCPSCGRTGKLPPVTPEHAAANARLLDGETAAWEAAHDQEAGAA